MAPILAQIKANVFTNTAALPLTSPLTGLPLLPNSSHTGLLSILRARWPLSVPQGLCACGFPLDAFPQLFCASHLLTLWVLA